MKNEKGVYQIEQMFNRMNDILEKFYINISHNPIVDDIIEPFEKCVLFNSSSNFIGFDLSYSSMT